MKALFRSNTFRIILRILFATAITYGLLYFSTWCTFTDEEMTYRYLGFALSLLTGFAIALPIRFPKILSGICYVLLPIAAFFFMECLSHDFTAMRLSVVPLALLFFYLLYTLFFFITGRMSFGFILANAIVLFIGVANYYVWEFRGNPILPWDLTSLSTAVSVADNFVFNGSHSLMLSGIGFAFCSALAEKCTLRLPSWRAMLIGLAASLLALGGYTAAIQTDFVGRMFNIYEMPFTQWYTYKVNGFFVSFLVNAKYLNVEVPQGYSADTAKDLLQSVTNTEPDATSSDRPNIVVIMNEAFSDLSVLGDFTTSEDYMPFLRSLMNDKNSISGSLYVSVLGGNTANTEFEFLTGASTAFLPTGSVAYQQFIKDKTPSLAHLLKEYGYETVAMHPYGATGWNRDTVYPDLGFDRALFRPDFASAKLIRGYVSDSSNYNQLIKEFEKKEKGTPFFLFDVTMQNHGSYSKEYANFKSTIQVNDQPIGTYPKAEQYLTLIKNADDALKELITYFKRTREKTIVVFFGDHQPTLLENAFFKELLGKSTDQMNLSELTNRYDVPFVIWANYEIEEERDLKLSVNYLSSLVLDAAGLDKPNYYHYLDKMCEEVPILTANFYRDAAGNLYTTNDKPNASDHLNDYAIVQYNQLFGGKNRLWEAFLPE